MRKKERLLVRILWWMDLNMFSTIRTDIWLEEDDLFPLLKVFHNALSIILQGFIPLSGMCVRPLNIYNFLFFHSEK